MPERHLTADQTDFARYGSCIHAFGRDIVAIIYLHFLKVSSNKHTDLSPLFDLNS